ncbi:MAG: hypothetical protein K2M95_05390 [Clostridiales bacterium]|nr:hypothetical protein [Clostridiales bacterium]
MKFLWRCLCAYVESFFRMFGHYRTAAKYSVRESLIGLLEVASVVAIFAVTATFLNVLIGMVITIGYIVVVIVIATIIEKAWKEKHN